MGGPSRKLHWCEDIQGNCSHCDALHSDQHRMQNNDFVQELLRRHGGRSTRLIEPSAHRPGNKSLRVAATKHEACRAYPECPAPHLQAARRTPYSCRCVDAVDVCFMAGETLQGLDMFLASPLKSASSQVVDEFSSRCVCGALRRPHLCVIADRRALHKREVES